LIKKVQQDLSQTQPEQFKIFLLASTVGLRRKEIDLLEWTAFHWEQGVLRIEPTKYFRPKSDWLSKSREIGALRSSEIPKMANCCPTESKQIPQINFSPERGS
jgi:hypothetical protein